MSGSAAVFRVYVGSFQTSVTLIISIILKPFTFYNSYSPLHWSQWSSLPHFFWTMSLNAPLRSLEHHLYIYHFKMSSVQVRMHQLNSLLSSLSIIWLLKIHRNLHSQKSKTRNRRFARLNPMQHNMSIMMLQHLFQTFIFQLLSVTCPQLKLPLAVLDTAVTECFMYLL